MQRRKVIQLLGLTLLSSARWGGARAVEALGLTQGIATAQITREARRMMGNVAVHITAVHADRQQAQAAVNAAFAEMQRLEGLLSVYRAESDIARVNRAAGQHAVPVCPDVYAVLTQALDVARLTEGAFNMALGAAMERWSFLERPAVPTLEERQRLRALTAVRDVVLDAQRQAVFLRTPGMRLDLGGIGKGFMAQRARQTLQQWGVHAGIVAGAGDLVLFGTRPDGRPWRVGVQHPRRPDTVLASLELTDCAISTSGDYERFFVRDGVLYHHILDADTLLPARGCQSVTVVGQDGGMVDALSTGLFVLGPGAATRLLEQQPHLGTGILIDADGRTSVSPALEARVVLHAS